MCYNLLMRKVLVQRKKAHLEFEYIERYEAGMELYGFEVKSLRAKRGSLEGAYVVVRGGEVYMLNAYIPPYQQANTPEWYDPTRTRRLLLHKKEIGELAGYDRQKGLTIVPISVYSKGDTIKVEIAAARGKRKPDKRATIREREEKRRTEKIMKGNY